MGVKLLIVEDDASVRATLVKLLEAKGYSVASFASGEDGVDGARREKPSIILLDVALPGIDGWETLRRLRADPKTAPIPVVMLTASSAADDIIRGYASGATYFVPKPYEPDELLRGISMALSESPPRAH